MLLAASLLPQIVHAQTLCQRWHPRRHASSIIGRAAGITGELSSSPSHPPPPSANQSMSTTTTSCSPVMPRPRVRPRRPGAARRNASSGAWNAPPPSRSSVAARSSCSMKCRGGARHFGSMAWT
ncbi:hypothetical protein PVAP13_1KG052000 [Panicum virgatum]|uniref:Uncharacterized protein n=1 Tax=Panicum virgatum TaxID=38727 RepID=A0A8T0XFJ9_PANVG|nr:hypothetical protein PVAP13_1KG052000 [Panicum virgatum]